MKGKRGRVDLVGAGCGAADLLTLRGAELLRQADAVVYDYLANPRLLELAPQAQRHYVGKKAAAHYRTQEQINALLIELARLGQRVVRLKGGDPFIFGRGGEECEALAEAKIEFGVVPGITSGIAAAAYAGIPLTHRDYNSSITFVTGHEKEEEFRDPATAARAVGAGSMDVDWAVLARLPALVFYMGVKALPRICGNLLENGMDEKTPAAAVRWGTTPLQQTVVGTLSDLAQKVAEAKLTAPAITVVGKIVSLRPKMNWFESRPLFGQTIAVTRTREQASALSAQLAELGARVIEAPTIQVHPPRDWSEVDAALGRGGEYDWIIFTSANGVAQVRRRLEELGKDVRIFGAARIAAIGPATQQAIGTQLALRVELCPGEFVAEALAQALIDQKQVAGRKFLLLRADIARPLLCDRLREAGASKVDDVAVYETRPADSLAPELLEALEDKSLNWITFTSSSTASNLATLLGADYPKRLQGVRLASIGPITSQTLRELGLAADVQAREYDINGLVEALTGAAAGEKSAGVYTAHPSA